MHGVSYAQKPNRTLPQTNKLFIEFQRNNPHLKQWKLLEHPTWTRGALLDPIKENTSFSFFLSDPNNIANCIIYTLCYMYGKACQVRLATSYTQHRQCGQ